MKNVKRIESKIKKLPVPEALEARLYFKRHPEQMLGVQKTFLKGINDLPLFAAMNEDAQTDLFESTSPSASLRDQK